MSRLSDKIASSPGLKVLAFVIANILSGVFVGTLIYELTSAQHYRISEESLELMITREFISHDSIATRHLKSTDYATPGDLKSDISRAIDAKFINGIILIEQNNSFPFYISNIFKTKSFYALILIMLLLYLYQRNLFKFETDILNFKDSEYCMAYLRSKCLPEMAEKYKNAIRNGSGDELLQAADVLQRALTK